jgi:tetratricopeptide (TPR) repeat protein
LSVPLLTELDLLGEGLEEVGELAEPLQGMELCAGAAFGHWVDRTREALLRRAREVLVQAVRDGRVEGCLEKVYRLALLLHRLDPVEPVAVLALAERALVDGDTIGAMRVMKEYLARVQAELGANPHPEIAALLRRLERGEGPALVFTGRFGIAPRMPREVFVSREQEIAQLEALWQQVGERVCQTCVIAGVAGIGKSTLARRFAMSVAARALPVYVVACQEIGAGIPFAAVADLILALGSDPLVSGTDPRWLAEASRVSPSLRSIYPGVPEPPPAPAESVRIRVADALVAMLESVSDGRPVLLVFDDVHHMDPASRDVLFLVTRRLERVHVVILGTLRAGDGSGTGWGREVGTLWWENWIRLGPLDDASVSRMVDLLVGEAGPVEGRVRERVLRLAQGNPYHAELLLTDWRQRGDQSLVMVEESGAARGWEWNPPDTFRSAFLAQYHDVSETARHVLHLLAVAARSMSAAEIAEVLNLQVRAVETALLSPIERGLLRIEGGRFQFKNDLHRAFLYYFIPANVRTFHHTILGHFLWLKATSSEFQPAIESARHFVRADMRAEAIEAAILGAERAIAKGAPHEASSVLSLILRTYGPDTDPRLSLLLGEALVAQGKFRDAVTAVNRLSGRQLAPAEQARKALTLAESLHRGRLADDAAIDAAVNDAISLSEQAASDTLLLRSLQLKAELAAEVGDLATLSQTRARSEAVAQASQSEECKALAGVTVGFCALVRGELASAAEAFQSAAGLLGKLSLFPDYRRVLNGLGICLTGLGRYEEAVKAFEETIATAKKLGNAVAMGNSKANLAWLYLDTGDFAKAVLHYRDAMYLFGEARSARLGAETFADVARLAILLGSYAEAAEAAERARLCAERTALWQHRVQALLAQADLLLALGEAESAWPLVEEALALTSQRYFLLPNSGQLLRLERHFLVATSGPESLESAPKPRPTGTLTRKGEILEVELFEEAVRPERSTSVLEEALRWQLLGPIARLLASRISHPGIEPALPGESSARQVIRLFRGEPHPLVPSLVGLPERIDV